MKILQRYTLPLLIIAGIILFYSRLTDLTKLVQVLHAGTWYIVLIAILLAIGIFILQSQLVQSLYSAFSIKQKIRHMLILIAGMNVANFVIPSVGFSGVTLFIADAKKHQIKAETALTVSLLYYLFYYTAFAFILILSLIYLFSITKLTPYEVITSAIFFIIIALFFSFFIITAWSLKHSIKTLNFLVAFANTPIRWLTKKDLIHKTRINEIAENMYQNLVHLKKNTYKLVLPGLFGLATHIIAIIMLGYIFVAFGYPITLSIILVGFSMAVLFSLISITPGGVGFVEGAMVVAFRSVGVPVEIALLVTFIFRGLTFWLPFIGGLVALRYLHQQIVPETN